MTWLLIGYLLVLRSVPHLCIGMINLYLSLSPPCSTYLAHRSVNIFFKNFSYQNQFRNSKYDLKMIVSLFKLNKKKIARDQTLNTHTTVTTEQLNLGKMLSFNLIFNLGLVQLLLFVSPMYAMNLNDPMCK